ncbi:hypothetical protein GCM10009745_33530 [Kribbella yunnanensis]|uniref:Uncharacterized protein n=1 Tax=Kribbella yunnanensis TaxID=190194 RepID=A0ABN2HE79_9ACTN
MPAAVLVEEPAGYPFECFDDDAAALCVGVEPVAELGSAVLDPEEGEVAEAEIALGVGNAPVVAGAGGALVG